MRQIPVVDPDKHHLFASLGCAVTNLGLAADAYGKSGEINFNADNNGSLVFTFGGTMPVQQNLVDAITKRQSTRAEYDGRPVSATDLQQLTRVSAIHGVDIGIITDRPQIDKVRDLVISGNTAQMADDTFVKELKTWIRFNPNTVMSTGDVSALQMSIHHLDRVSSIILVVPLAYKLLTQTNPAPPLPTWLEKTTLSVIDEVMAAIVDLLVIVKDGSSPLSN
jgi:hypothetical protein